MRRWSLLLYASISCRPLWYTPTLYHSRPYPNSLGLSRHRWSHDCIVLSRSRIWLFHGFSVLCSFIYIKYNNCYNLKNVWKEGPSQLTPTFKHEKRPDSRVRPFLQILFREARAGDETIYASL